MPRKHIEIEGIRVKYRTDERDGRPTATATIWIDDKPLQEIASIDLKLFESPGSPEYQGWLDAVSAAFERWLQRKTGSDAIVTKRKAPRYKGERP